MESAQPQVTPETATPATQSTPAPQAGGLDFIPEGYRQSGWASKYKTPDEFFKGIDNTFKLVGQKQIVEGVKLPGDDATDEDYTNFFNQIGRPDSPESYVLPDLEAHEGFDLATEKTVFSKLAHESGLNPKQAQLLFGKYVDLMNKGFTESQQQGQASLAESVKTAFPENPKAGFEAAKRGAKALGIGDKLDEAGLSANPLVLQLCARVGELAGEDNIIRGNDPSSNESLLEEAHRLQRSNLYQKGDPATLRRVDEIYATVYPE